MQHKKRSHHEEYVATHPTTPSTSSKQPGVAVKPSRDEVAVKAYLIYVNQNYPQGRDVQHWLEAEAQTIAVSEPKVTAP
jgi:hypothetical protein